MTATTKTAKASKSAKKAKVSAATPNDDGLDIPASLKVENRKPLPAQQEKVSATEKPAAAKEPKPAEPKKPAPVKIAKTKKATAPSMSHALKALVVRAPKMPLEQLVAELEKAGFTGRSKVTIATLRSDGRIRRTMARTATQFNIAVAE
jgi:hypothetical protein